MTMPILYIAPVRGISDIVYRNCFARHFTGIDIAMTPFVTTVKGNQMKESQKQQLELDRNAMPIIPQIIGKSADNFIALSTIFEEQGHTEVNWNLGCPHPTMTRKKCGSGLLPHPELIDSFLENVCSRLELDISVKVRLGLDAPEELSKLMQIFNRYPLKEITIHPRLGKQMYKGSVDLDTFETVLPLCDHRIVYNGDIFSVEDFERISSRFPEIDRFMLGRGLFMNPFLADQIKGQKSPDLKAKLITFHNDLFEGYGELLSGHAHLIQRMAGHWEYLQHSFKNGNKAYRKIKKAKTLDDYNSALELAL